MSVNDTTYEAAACGPSTQQALNGPAVYRRCSWNGTHCCGEDGVSPRPPPSDHDLLKHRTRPSFVSAPGALHMICTLLTSAESLETDIPKEGRQGRALHALCPTATRALNLSCSSVHSRTSLCGTCNTFLGSGGVI